MDSRRCRQERSINRGRRIGVIGAVLIGIAFDTQGAIGITSRDVRFVIAISGGDTRIVFFDPGVNILVLDVESDRLTQASNPGL